MTSLRSRGQKCPDTRPRRPRLTRERMLGLQRLVFEAAANAVVDGRELSMEERTAVDYVTKMSRWFNNKHEVNQ